MSDVKLKQLIPIINACGEKAQQLKAIEELSELQKELCKHLLNPTIESKEKVTEEMADVLLMLDQLLIIFDNEKDVQKTIQNKIERTYNRLGISAEEK